mgnify:CR=1 FL=1
MVGAYDKLFFDHGDVYPVEHSNAEFQDQAHLEQDVKDVISEKMMEQSAECFGEGVACEKNKCEEVGLHGAEFEEV